MSTVTQQVNKFSSFTQPECSLPCSYKTSLDHILSKWSSQSSTSRPISLIFILILHLHLHMGLRVFPSSFQYKLLCALYSFISLMRAMYPAHPILLALTTLPIYGEAPHYATSLLSLIPAYVQIFSSESYSETPLIYVLWETKFNNLTIILSYILIFTVFRGNWET
jgi:hypothetical protein